MCRNTENNFMSVKLEGCMCSMQWQLGAWEAPKHLPEGVKQFQGKLCRESQIHPEFQRAVRQTTV